MRPTEIQEIGSELAILWEDGTETFIPLEKLRRYCPCAGCKGEPDILGNLHRGPHHSLVPNSSRLVRLGHVGSYGIQPSWADGHNTGIYSFDYLKQVSKAK